MSLILADLLESIKILEERDVTYRFKFVKTNGTIIEYVRNSDHNNLSEETDKIAIRNEINKISSIISNIDVNSDIIEAFINCPEIGFSSDFKNVKKMKEFNCTDDVLKNYMKKLDILDEPDVDKSKNSEAFLFSPAQTEKLDLCVSLINNEPNVMNALAIMFTSEFNTVPFTTVISYLEYKVKQSQQQENKLNESDDFMTVKNAILNDKGPLTYLMFLNSQLGFGVELEKPIPKDKEDKIISTLANIIKKNHGVPFGVLMTGVIQIVKSDFDLSEIDFTLFMKSKFGNISKQINPFNNLNFQGFGPMAGGPMYSSGCMFPRI